MFGFFENKEELKYIPGHVYKVKFYRKTGYVTNSTTCIMKLESEYTNKSENRIYGRVLKFLDGIELKYTYVDNHTVILEHMGEFEKYKKQYPEEFI